MAHMSARDTIEFLHKRRSVLAANMVEPGPTTSDLRDIIQAGIRVPDHGKIEPWRIQIVDKLGQVELGDIHARSLVDREDCSEAQLRAARERLGRSPVLLVVSCHPNPKRFDKVPLIEQQLSAGAVCMNLLTAAGCMGYAAQWLTGGPAYDPAVKAALNIAADQQIVGFIHLGSVADAPRERPRPDYQAIVSDYVPEA